MIEMKDCGVEWLNLIPSTWEVKRLKNVLNERKENNNPVKTENILSLTNDRGIIPYAEKGNHGNKSKEDITGYKLAYENDIVMNSMNIVIGSVGLSKYYGCVSPVYYMLYTNRYNINYYNYIFQSKVFQNELRGLGNGILEIRMRIPMEKMNNVLMPIPPIEVQQKISNFLDKKVTEIDNVIEKTKETIENYKKYKQSIITEVITKGLNANIQLKDSRIEWLGYIPENWNLSKIKMFTIKVGSGKTPKGDDNLYSEGNILFLRSQNIYNTGLQLSENPTMITNEIDNEMANTRVQYNDILLNITGGSIGRCCIYNIKEKANVNQHVCIIRVNQEKILPQYMHYFWISKLGEISIGLYQTGGNREGMSADAIKNTYIPVIPIEEQKNIIEYLNAKCIEIDSLIYKKEEIVEELEKYKNSLIYEYVTGKKEVI